jgi:N,N'-diacetyllegionaminate synthase
VKIGARKIGPGEPVYVIAEVGVNHDGELARALSMVDACAAAGADAVKFQAFDPLELATAGAELAEYQRRSGVEIRSQVQMLERLALTESDFRTIAARCRERGVDFLGSPFDAASGALLARLGVPAIKVGSGELTNLPLLRELAAHRLPLLLSTGMADLDEVHAAVAAVDPVPIVLLHCVSSYPTPFEQANLRAIGTLRHTFENVVVGYSDHCEGLDVSLAAVALGVAVLERHVTYDRSAPGPDHAISLLPGELAELIRRARVIECALGDGRKAPQPAERDTMSVARRSLVATRRIAPGEVIDEMAVTAKRPAGGLPPSRLSDLIGRTAARVIKPDEQFVEADL